MDVENCAIFFFIAYANNSFNWKDFSHQDDELDSIKIFESNFYGNLRASIKNSCNYK